MTRTFIIALAMTAGSATASFADSEVVTGRGYVDTMNYAIEQDNKRYSHDQMTRYSREQTTAQSEGEDVASRGARDPATFSTIDLDNMEMENGDIARPGHSVRALRR